MLKDEDLPDSMWDGIREKGKALCWVIGEDVLYDLPLSKDNADIFLNHDEVLDISNEYPDHDGITVRFMKDGEIIEELQTSEYFGSILLSSPKIVNLADYPYGRYVSSPNAKFINNSFLINNENMEELEKW